MFERHTKPIAPLLRGRISGDESEDFELQPIQGQAPGSLLLLRRCRRLNANGTLSVWARLIFVEWSGCRVAGMQQECGDFFVAVVSRAKATMTSEDHVPVCLLGWFTQICVYGSPTRENGREPVYETPGSRPQNETPGVSWEIRDPGLGSILKNESPVTQFRPVLVPQPS